jgi:peptidoglycan biosynthesis protein MviN/MurJ (putative lipid II flippase)
MPDEDPKERVDRELIELLNEIRVALPGVQVLFAFLLILPFQQTFADTTAEDQAVYALALLASALATAMLIAPSMYHRLNFRGGRKEQMLFDSNKLLIAGTMLTGVGVACAVFLVVDVVYGGIAAMIATLVVVVVYAVAWIGLPLLRRGDDEA